MFLRSTPFFVPIQPNPVLGRIPITTALVPKFAIGTVVLAASCALPACYICLVPSCEDLGTSAIPISRPRTHLYQDVSHDEVFRMSTHLRTALMGVHVIIFPVRGWSGVSLPRSRLGLSNFRSVCGRSRENLSVM